MNFRVGPQAAAVVVLTNLDTPSQIEIVFNCNVDATKLVTAGMNLGGAAATLPFTQIDDNRIRTTADAQVLSNDFANIDLTQQTAFGPNITGCISILYTQEL